MRRFARSSLAWWLLGACAPVAPLGPEPVVPGEFTLAVLPDTQGYSQQYPDIYEAQTSWLAAQAAMLDLKLVVHLGDVVEGSWLSNEWEVARHAMSLLGDVPYVIAPGNHDLGATWDERNARARTTLLHSYFPRETFERMPTFGGFYPEGDRVDNSFHVFEAAGERWLVLALEFGPRDDVVAWADEVLAAHGDHRAIVATHAYLYSDDTRYDWARLGAAQQWNPYAYGIASSPEGVNDGQELWDRLISRHANVTTVLSGHVLNDGLGYAVSRGAGTVHELLVNYQMNEYAGAGFLRLLRVAPSERKIHVTTFSPWLNDEQDDGSNRFSLAY